MGWDKEINKIKEVLKEKGTEQEIEDFINSQYLDVIGFREDPNNIINSFDEYIQDIMEWDLYKKTVEDGYN